MDVVFYLLIDEDSQRVRVRVGRMADDLSISPRPALPSDFRLVQEGVWCACLSLPRASEVAVHGGVVFPWWIRICSSNSPCLLGFAARYRAKRGERETHTHA